MKKISLIIFDLDGVLVDAKKIHFSALNEALCEIDKRFCISETDHLKTFDGLKTNDKLDILSNERGLKKEDHKKIWERKQSLTAEKISNLCQDERLVDCFKNLRLAGFKIACCSNSIRRSVFLMLAKKGLIEYFDLILSNEDVINPKPHAEIYWKAMSILKVNPEETLIIEDSPNGLLAAERSGGHVMRVCSPEDISFENLQRNINEKKQILSQNGKIKN